MLEGWQTFSRDALRLLPARVASWTTALARMRARLPLIVTFSVKGAGEIEIRPDQVFFPEGGTYPDLDGLDWFPLERDSQRGWVGVDRRLALTLVRAVLAGPDPATIRPIGRAERGIMASILLCALDRLKVSPAVHLGLGLPSGQPDHAQERLAIECSVHTAAGVGGRALLLIPVGWLAEISGPVMGHMEGVAIHATLELARTDLPGSAVTLAGLGDAVVFEGVPAIEAESWPAWLRVGKYLAPALVAPDNRLSLAGPFSQVEEDSNPMAAQDENPEWTPAEPSSSEVTDLVASAPVEVVAEIGRLTLRGDELAGLMKGSVLCLGPRRTEAIQLRVGGRLWAVGELVNLGDQLGVRISKLHAG
jgi:flagellar motor switch/type III secretory pathway protein FliN